jgi:hypothetical protein
MCLYFHDILAELGIATLHQLVDMGVKTMLSIAYKLLAKKNQADVRRLPPTQDSPDDE